jgi:hypothetical protein
VALAFLRNLPFSRPSACLTCLAQILHWIKTPLMGHCSFVSGQFTNWASDQLKWKMEHITLCLPHLYFWNYCAKPISAPASCRYEALNYISWNLACCVVVILFSGYAIFQSCHLLVITFSGFCFFRFLNFPVIASSCLILSRLLHLPVYHY